MSDPNDLRLLHLPAALTALALAGCVQITHAPPAADCARVTFPDDRFISQSFTDKFTGRFWNGERYLDIVREGQRMFVRRQDAAQRQLQRLGDTAGAGSFRDGCGTGYEFILPPDGPGGYVTITEPAGTRSEWHRR